MFVHLKDKAKIRHKKRWSQCMYMYYLLGFKLMELPISDERKQVEKMLSHCCKRKRKSH
jgi:chitin synthase